MSSKSSFITFAKACYSGCLKTAKGWRYILRGFPVTARKWPIASKYICLVVACLSVFPASTAFQNAWQNGMRAIYNQTEIEANLVSTMGLLGSTIMLPSGIIYELYGSQMNALISFIMAAFSYFLLWLGTSTMGNWRQTFAHNQSIVLVLYFFVGQCGAYVYMAIFMSNAENFSYEMRGTIYGILDTALSVGPTILSVLYNTVFANGKTQPGEEDQQNLSGYFLTLGIVGLASNMLIFLFVGPIRRQASPPDADDDEAPIIAQSDEEKPPVADYGAVVNYSRAEQSDATGDGGAGQDNNPPSLFSEYPFKEVPFYRVIFNWSFWYAAVQFLLCCSLQTTYQSNIPSYLRSFNMNEHNLLFTTLSTAIAAAAKLASGVISDLLAHTGRVPRAVIFLIPYTLQTAVLLISAFYGNNFVLMIFTCVIIGIASAVTWCQTPVIMGELFGTKHLASNWGLVMLTSAGMGFPFSISFGAIYDSGITQPGEIYCYGLQCFTWSFILLGGTSLCGLIMAIGLTQNMFRNARDRRMANEARLPNTTSSS